MTLPKGWQLTTIGETAELIRGVTYDKASARSVNERDLVPIARATNIQNGQLDRDALIYVPSRFVDDRQKLRSGDILIATSSGSRAVVGKSAQVGVQHEDMSFGAFCGVVRATDEQTGDWLSKVFASADYRAFVDAVAIGTNINNFRSRDLLNFEFPLPPLAEQRRIVAKLDALTARLARARAELDRVPVLAKRLLNTAYRGAFTSRRLVPLEQLTPSGAPIIYGILQPGPDLADGVPYVRPSEIDRGMIKLNEVRRTSPEIAHQYRRAVIREGDIILTIVGTIGKVAIVPRELDGGNITQSSCRIRPDTTQVNTAYLRQWLRSPSAWRQYDAKRLGTAVPRLNIRDIRAFKVPLPSLADQKRIAALLDAEEARCLRATQEATRARTLLDRLEAAILARAFRGELVPQDPTDEPATALLARIRAQRAAAPKAKRGRRARGHPQDLANADQ